MTWGAARPWQADCERGSTLCGRAAKRNRRHLVIRQPKPLVVQYLYVHTSGEAFFYPSVRSRPSADSVATRYLECALVQAASLRLRNVDCGLALVTNTAESSLLGRSGTRLLRALEDLDVAIVHSDYHHRPTDDDAHYVASRYVFDAILAAGEGQPDERPLFMTDLDCVWVDPPALFEAVPSPPEVGCLYIEYPADGDGVGSGEVGRTRRKMGALADSLAGAVERVPSLAGGGLAEAPQLSERERERRALDALHLPRWVGGELLVGTAGALRELVGACERVDALMAERGESLLTEEQVLTLAGALGLVQFRELHDLAWRVHTGPRHEAHVGEDTLSLGLWHLPSEKGLSLRRTANEICRGRTRHLRRDLADPARMARRFNVADASIFRRIRDDGWIAGLRASNILQARLRGALGRR
jgi:hypothetical protein